MAHEHSVIDKDTHFVIDPATMAITCASAVKPLKRGDHRAEKYSFTMPRYVEGHDMALCNKVEVHYNNIHYDLSTRETTTNKSFDDVEDFGISKASEDTVTWIWNVKGDATQLDGTLNFCMRFACMNGEEIEYQKFSEVYSSIKVGESIWNTDEVAKAYADVLEAWRDEIITEAIPNAVNEAMQKAKESGEFNGADGKDGVSVTHEWEGTVLKITSASGTSSADLKGADGVIGKDGKTAYEYAKDGGYTGTEEEFAAKMAQEIPEGEGVTVSNVATPGQMLLVKAVDEKGKPTELETMDRTHYCETKTVNLSFDGNLENYEHTAVGDGQYLVKVSDQIFTKEELAGATIIANIQGGDQIFNLDGGAIPDKADDSPLVSIAELMFILYEDTDALGVPLTSGTYFVYIVDNLQIKTLSNRYEVVKKLGNKFVDAEWMATKTVHAEELLPETTFSADSNLTDIDLDRLGIGEKLTVTVDGTRYTCEVKEFQAEDVSGIYAGNLALAGAGENNGAPFCVIYANTVTSVMLMLQNAGATVSIQGESYEYNKLPDGYIPEKFSTPSFDFIAMGMSLIRTNQTYSLEVGEDVVAEMLEAAQRDKVRVRFKASFYDGTNYHSQIVSATADTAVELFNSGRVSAGQFNLVLKAPYGTSDSWYAVTFHFETATVYANCTRLVPNPVLTSPNGTKYKLTVADDGTLSAVAVT